MTATLTLEGTSLVLQCKYDAGLVAALKSTVPPSDRRFDPARKAWLVTPKWGAKVAALITAYLGEMVFVPNVVTKTEPTLKTLEIKYLGATKSRDGADERSAFGYCENSWSVLFPESVLITWFTGLNQSPQDALTYYGTLGVNRGATNEEIKTAFRRLARQWHPDVCRESNAKEQFIKIKAAFDILSSDTTRPRYDAGLALEASIKRDDGQFSPLTGYRAPLRCGHVLAEVVYGLVFTVNKILAWEDIYNQQGQVLVVSWPFGAKTFEERYV
jgi:hypothetical protein